MKNSIFWVGHFEFFQKEIPHENQFLGQQGWLEILVITLVSSKFLTMRNITLYSVFLNIVKYSISNLLSATMVHKTFKITKLKRLWTKNGWHFCSMKYSPILSASSIRICSIDDFPKPRSLKFLSANFLWDFHAGPSLNKIPTKIQW